MKLGQVTLGMLALLALLIAPLGEVAGQTQAQKDAVAGATSVFAAGAPHGTWQQLIEPVKFYMVGGTAGTGGFGLPDGKLEYVVPTTTQTVNIGLNSPAVFTMATAQMPSTGVPLHRATVGFTANCITGLGLPTDPELTISLGGMDYDPDATGTQGRSALVASTGNANTARLYQTTFDFTSPPSVSSAAAPTITISAAVDGVRCEIAYGRESAHVTMFTESASVNMWTAAKSGSTPGNFIRSLPHASKVLPAQRAFEVHMAYTSSWPCLNGNDAGDADANTCAAGANPNSDVIEKAFSEGRLALRVRNVDTSSVQSSGSVVGAASITHLASGAEARVHVVSYTNSFQTGAYSSAEGAKPGRFQFEVYSAMDFVTSNILAIGGKSFTFAPVGIADRNVNVGEPTTYRLLVTNTGTERDTITVSLSSDDAAWKVNVLNGQVTVEPNAQAEVLVRVTPPAQGVPGDSVQLTARAVSSFPNEVAPITRVLSVNIVAAVTTGAVMTGPTSAIEVYAGDKLDLSGFKLRNTGTSVGTYVIETSYVPSSSAWRAGATPASRTIDAASVDDFSLQIDVPTTAAAGESRVLKIQARLLGGGVPDLAKLEIPFSVVFKAGLDVSQRDEVREVRDDTGATNPVDSDNDQSMIFRMTLTNPTAVAQTFTVTNTWAGANTQQCGASTFKGWTMGYWDATAGAFDANFGAAGQALAKDLSGLSITMAGSEVRDIYVVMQWNTGLPAGCGRAATQDLELTFQNTQDTDFKTSATMQAKVVGSGLTTRAPTFEAGRTAAGTIQKTEGGAVRDGNAFTPAKFLFSVINDGRETDSYTIEMPPAPSAGWTHTIAYLSTTAGTVLHQGPGTGAPTCLPPTSGGRVIRCNNIGVGDELHFELTVTPPSNEALGRTMTSSIIVTSLEQSEIKSFGSFRTRTVGQNDFALESLRGQPTTVAKGAQAALPFQIRNVGTAGDSYTLAITAASSDTSTWKPRFSGSVGGQQEITVPGGSDYNGFLLVEAPATGATTNSEHTFTLQVTSGATSAKKSVVLTAKVVDPTPDQISGKTGNNVLLASPGVANDVTVVFASSNTCTASLTADVDALPETWSVAAPTTKTVALTGSGATKAGEVVFKVTPPADVLGTSNTALRVTGQCPGGAVAYADLVLSVKVKAGVDLALVSPNVQFVSPGGPTRWEMDVINSGLDRDTISLSASALPPGWSVAFEARQLSVAPIDTVRTTFDVVAPANAAPRSNVTFNVLATSQTDSSVIKQVTVSAVVGFRDILLSPAAVKLDGAPEQAVSFVVPVTNAGTLSDRIQLTTAVTTPGYENQVKARVTPGTIELVKGQVREAIVTLDIGRTVPADVDISVELMATSLFSPNVNTTQNLTVHILKFERADVDGDLVDEYALDANNNAADGFEVFRDSTAPGGRQTISADLARFLNAAGKAALNATNATQPFIDGDKDGKRDHFLDDTGDGLPNIYWDPDNKHSMRLSVAKDVDADAVIDYFVDTSGNGRLDRLYNVVTGKWTPLIAIDGDNGRVSYIVDKNENGQADADESILVVALGRVASVTLKVDMDNDGKLDTVVDEDGDDRVDFFVRAGESRERRIILQDVNGDGVEDWTYDSNLDGRPDRYYDPVAQTGGHQIDHAANFSELVKTYWYVPVLFLLVAILFIVLVAVTRR